MRAEDEAEFVRYLNGRLVSLRRSGYRLCGDWHQAEDLAQIVGMKLHRHWRRARAAGNLDAYVQRMLVRAWLDEQRRPWHRLRTVAAMPDRAAPAGSEPEIRLVLLQALARLAPRQRAAVVLRFWEGRSVGETAAAMDCSPASVKRYASAGAAALRLLLPDYLPSQSAELTEGTGPI